jgi:hypothetical protein
VIPGCKNKSKNNRGSFDSAPLRMTAFLGWGRVPKKAKGGDESPPFNWLE